METHPPAPTSATPQSLVTSVGWFVVILATLYVCYFSHLGAVGFVGPDEPRYAWIARDMAETGDWITPRLYGKPWFEKPPLYYWGAAVSFKLFGVSEAAARLPSAIAALLGTLALAWLAWRVYGGETARWLLLLLPTTVGMIGFSHAAATDMPFAGTLTCAMVAAAVLLGLVPSLNRASGDTERKRTRLSSLFDFSVRSTWLASALFGFFLGRATLAKGPAAFILCGGAVFFWALITRRWRDVARLFHVAGLVVFCGTALPWYLVCAYRNPDFFRVFIIEHNFKRFLTPEFQHIQPPWFYVGVILIAFLPWTAALVWALTVGLRKVIRRQRLSPFNYFLLCWSGFCVLFFTISRSKLPGYILPAVPAIGLLLAHSVVTLGSTKRRSFAVASIAATLLFGVGFFAIQSHGATLLKNSAAFSTLFSVLLIALGTANLFLGLLFLFNRRSAALVTATLVILLTFPLVDEVLNFTPISVVSARYLAAQLQAERVPVASLCLLDVKRATIYGLNFYLRSDLQPWDGNPSRATYLLATGPSPCDRIPQQMTCSEVWGKAVKADDFELLHLTPKP